MSIFVWSNFALIDATFGLLGFMPKTTCLSERVIGTELVEDIERVFDFRLPVGEVGVGGGDSSADVETCCCTVLRGGGTQKVGSSVLIDVGLILPLQIEREREHSLMLSALKAAAPATSGSVLLNEGVNYISAVSLKFFSVSKLTTVRYPVSPQPIPVDFSQTN